MAIPTKIAYQVTKITGKNEENVGLYFDRVVAEHRLSWWEKRHVCDDNVWFRIDEKSFPEDQWHRLHEAAHLCDSAAIIMQKEGKL